LGWNDGFAVLHSDQRGLALGRTLRIELFELRFAADNRQPILRLGQWLLRAPFTLTD
jgi:hypothetical protein